VYFGWAKIIAAPGQPAVDSGVYKAFVSLGTNPQFQTVEDTAEAYIFNDYGGDFYGQTMQLLICGHIRAMCAFDSLDALIAAINNDVKIGSEALDAEDLAALKDDAFFQAQSNAAAAE
jgi:riboflavin kinase/FMN adenylyltransferase